MKEIMGHDITQYLTALSQPGALAAGQWPDLLNHSYVCGHFLCALHNCIALGQYMPAGAHTYGMRLLLLSRSYMTNHAVSLAGMMNRRQLICNWLLIAHLMGI